jgi:hypothetical protein
MQFVRLNKVSVVVSVICGMIEGNERDFVAKDLEVVAAYFRYPLLASRL